MESAPEEHSSQTLPMTFSNPNFRNERTSLDSRPDSAPEPTAVSNPGEGREESPSKEVPRKGLETLKESEELPGSSLASKAPSESQTGGKAAASRQEAAAEPGTGGQEDQSEDLSSAANLLKSRGDSLAPVLQLVMLACKLE